ncbi:MAG: hypothetical protein RLZZ480_813 [Candidatus Parcubacteria bacterium]
MKKRSFIASLLIGSVLLPTAAIAQESPSGTWGNSVTWRNPFERSVDIQRAEAQQRSRRGGYGPAEVNTTYNGPVTTNNEYNGAVSSSNSTNAVNLTTYDSSVSNGNGTVGVTFTTGNTSYQANQTATSQTTNSGGNASTNSGSSTTNNGSGF